MKDLKASDKENLVRHIETYNDEPNLIPRIMSNLIKAELAKLIESKEPLSVEKQQEIHISLDFLLGIQDCFAR